MRLSSWLVASLMCAQSSAQALPIVAAMVVPSQQPRVALPVDAILQGVGDNAPVSLAAVVRPTSRSEWQPVYEDMQRAMVPALQGHPRVRSLVVLEDPEAARNTPDMSLAQGAADNGVQFLLVLRLEEPENARSAYPDVVFTVLDARGVEVHSERVSYRLLWDPPLAEPGAAPPSLPAPSPETGSGNTPGKPEEVEDVNAPPKPALAEDLAVLGGGLGMGVLSLLGASLAVFAGVLCFAASTSSPTGTTSGIYLALAAWILAPLLALGCPVFPAVGGATWLLRHNPTWFGGLGGSSVVRGISGFCLGCCVPSPRAPSSSAPPPPGTVVVVQPPYNPYDPYYNQPPPPPRPQPGPSHGGSPQPAPAPPPRAPTPKADHSRDGQHSSGGGSTGGRDAVIRQPGAVAPAPAPAETEEQRKKKEREKKEGVRPGMRGR